MHLIQFRAGDGSRRVGIVRDADTVALVPDFATIYDLATAAIARGVRLRDAMAGIRAEETLDYGALVAENRLLSPIDHPDPAHCLVTGTGLTHLGAAAARQKMHAAGDSDDDDEHLTDSMRIFRMGLEGGKPGPGRLGVQPEWFFKGDGSCVVAPGLPLEMPDFGLDGGEEPEIAGIYLIGADGHPRRLGFTLGNEFSDHVTERKNYLYLAHSKLRTCAIGPELLVRELPADIHGTARILRQGRVAWERAFLTGEDNMSHAIANLEAHHFKYPLFRRPGDVHIHFFGTATLSFADGVRTEPGDIVEIEAPPFGRPLRNPLAARAVEPPVVTPL